jgi:hypothetical protein
VCPPGIMTKPQAPRPPAPPSPPAIETQLYIDAHKHASRHRHELEASPRCGCFFCFKTFAVGTIKSWIDANQTALCPHCGVDAVIGEFAVRIDDQFLRRMHRHHFAYRSK